MERGVITNSPAPRVIGARLRLEKRLLKNRGLAPTGTAALPAPSALKLNARPSTIKFVDKILDSERPSPGATVELFALD